MESQSAFQVEFDFGTSKPVVVEPSTAQLSSDAGLLPFRQLDEQLELTASFVACLKDRRDAESIRHTLLEMVRMRSYGILADHADQNDHDTLRCDPVFKLLCDRSIHDDDLASQPTLSRFENAIDTGSLLKLRDWLIDQFIAAFEAPPARLTLDIDPFDDPTHGQQQLTFFHGYYGQYQYLPRVITCAENDLVDFRRSRTLWKSFERAAPNAKLQMNFYLLTFCARWSYVWKRLRSPRSEKGDPC